ncbi:serine hydrolase domain-containing protein [Streptomyces thermolineatus]|uniref:serine hydrolase domain-containing protein n=1 Tax=Streptomyces thermolineatus TaxID=44033 RepID=UPI00384BE3C2
MTKPAARPTARRGLRRIAVGFGAVVLTVTALPAAAAAPAATAGQGARTAATATGTATAAGTAPGIDPAALQQSLDALRDAGMYGAYSAVRDGGESWAGATGVADVDTGRPADAGMRHRVGSVTKTFTAVAVLQLVEAGRIGLDDPIGDHLPELVPGERGRAVTVRMLLNHTSGIADYLETVFPSFAERSPRSIHDNRFRAFGEEELVRHGLAAPPTGEPGEKWAYSNTNYVLAGLLLEKVTGTTAEKYIARNVIERAGLRDTSFPATPFVPGPHSAAYEAFFGTLDPPRDYSVYHPSAFDTAGALVSTVDDVNRFYRQLFQGALLGPEQLAEMRRTVPITDEQGNAAGHYGLGLFATDLPCGRFWGHNGTVMGMSTLALSSADGRRQVTTGTNLTKYNDLDENGVPRPHPIDAAWDRHTLTALCPGAPADTTRTTGSLLPG